MSDKILHLNKESFDDLVAGSDKPVIVDFWAPWCGPCLALAPTLEELAEEMPGAQFGKVDVDNNQELAAKFNIRSIPTLLIFKNGDVVDQAVGLLGKDALKRKIQAQM